MEIDLSYMSNKTHSIETYMAYANVVNKNTQEYNTYGE